ncbi:MAG: sulfurtransferase [Myxococcota bacterium]
MSYPHSPLMQVQALHELLGHPTWRVVDCRWSLMAPPKGRQEYQTGHIPGAVFVDLDTELADKAAGGGRHPLPSEEKLRALLEQRGISDETSVLVYDDTAGSVAGRLWWTLRAFGHSNVWVLEGGIQAWTQAGFPLEAGGVRVEPGHFTRRLDRSCWVDAEQVAARSPETVLIDARAGERFRGEQEPIDPVAGHIPGALNLAFMGNLEQGRFKSPELLRARFAEAGIQAGPEVIAYCGSGVTACHNLLALEHAGLLGARLYVGSWSDWVSRPGAPVEVGASPR